MNDFFSEIIGHEEQVTQLRTMLRSRGELRQAGMPHAMIFSGPNGVGKRSIALACAGEILSAYDSGREEESKASRALVRAGTHPDLHLALREEGKKDISVETIRELRNRLKLKPYLGRAVTVIIDEAELMNASAYNALLKTLEEPNDATFIFLITNRLHALPETIRSRCQLMHFSSLNPKHLQMLLAALFPSLAEDQKTLGQIRALCGDSLEKLSLGQYILPRQFGSTSLVSKGVEEHIQEQVGLFSTMHRDLESLLGSQDLARALSLASTLTAQKGNESVFWTSLRLALYRRLRQNPTTALAEVLTQALDAEQLGLQRNVNQTVLASEILCKAASVRL